MPTSPPRKLVLVRDVTAAKVADQTIRSLFQFLQDRDEDRTRLLRRTNAAIEAERNRVARDLHDGPVQGVSAASLSLEAALLMIKAGEIDRGMEVLTKIREELAEEADALRRLMSGLRPPVLEERGLIPALRETLSRFGTDHEVHTEFIGRVPERPPRRPGDARLPRGAGSPVERRQARRPPLVIVTRGRRRLAAADRDRRRRVRVRQRRDPRVPAAGPGGPGVDA